MRVYIIGNDGITLCRTAPAAVNDGEIAVASDCLPQPSCHKRLKSLNSFSVGLLGRLDRVRESAS